MVSGGLRGRKNGSKANLQTEVPAWAYAHSSKASDLELKRREEVFTYEDPISNAYCLVL